MGNCCSGGDEPKRATPFAATDGSSDGFQPDLALTSTDDETNAALQQQQQQQESLLQQQQQQQQQEQQKQQQQAAADGQAKLKAMREEQNRLDLIVQMAGRGMVSVRSTRGSTGYYDQGFAAALGQHLEQTTKFPDQLPIRLPPHTTTTSNSNDATATTTAATATASSSSAAGAGSASTSNTSTSSSTSTSTVFQRLSQPQWENIALGKKGIGMAGCDGENPNTYMDHVAVSFLDSVVPKKERIFHGGVGPMVENLL